MRPVPPEWADPSPEEGARFATGSGHAPRSGLV